MNPSNKKLDPYFYTLPNYYLKCFRLFLNYRNSFKGYGFILETVCLEVIGSKNVDSNLKPILKSFLNSEYFFKWTEVSILNLV